MFLTTRKEHSLMKVKYNVKPWLEQMFYAKMCPFTCKYDWQYLGAGEVI